MAQLAYGELDLLVLVCQPVVVVEVEAPLDAPVRHELLAQTEEYGEVALTAHHPDRVLGRLVVGANLHEATALCKVV